jgi:hypothetical protein
MAYLGKFWLRKRPCFECDDEGTSFRYPWVELLLALPIDAVVSGARFEREVTNDPFSTGEEFRALCPYCRLDSFPDDDYEYRFPDSY